MHEACFRICELYYLVHYVYEECSLFILGLLMISLNNGVKFTVKHASFGYMQVLFSSLESLHQVTE